MRTRVFYFIIFMFCLNPLSSSESGVDRNQGRIGTSAETDHFMSSAYWDLWNPEVQSRIDKDIDQYRKADAILNIPDLPPGAEVKVKQVSHDFVFGSNIFNYNQLGTIERNRKYKELFGLTELFDSIWADSAINERIEKGIENYRKGDVSITVLDSRGRPARNTPVKIEQTGHEFLFGTTLFMLDGFETEEQNRRFEEMFLSLFNHGSLPFYWKTLEPEQGNIRFEKDSEFIYRRPPPDAVVEFCQKHSIYPKGHPIVWDNQQWAYPDWLPDDEDKIWELMERHIEKIAARYGKTIPMWDVVNELYRRHEHMTKPYDFGFQSFEKAASVFPPETQLIINDVTAVWMDIKREYSSYYLIIENMLLKGAKIDGIGLQCHFMGTPIRDVLAGKIMHPRDIFKVMDTYAYFGKPLHITEITIPTINTPDGQEIQAKVTENLYRIWFSHPNMESIVWWNMVDNTAAPGQDRWLGGVLDENMQPKKSYHVLNRLINKEWKTRMDTRTNNDGQTGYRGFYGEYTITVGTGRKATKHVINVLKGKEHEFVIKL